MQYELAVAQGVSDHDGEEGTPQLAMEFQRYVSQWHNLSMEERGVKVSTWALRLKTLQTDASPKRLRRLILQAAAALSPPRLAAAGESDGTGAVREEHRVARQSHLEGFAGQSCVWGIRGEEFRMLIIVNRPVFSTQQVFVKGASSAWARTCLQVWRNGTHHPERIRIQIHVPSWPKLSFCNDA